MSNVNWAKIEEELINASLHQLWNELPHKFTMDAASFSVKECLDWINSENQSNIKTGLFPIYGYVNEGSYEANCEFLLVEPETGLFYDISGGHCSCYGFEGQFTPELCPLEYIAKGKNWEGAYETVLKVIKYFKDKQN